MCLGWLCTELDTKPRRLQHPQPGGESTLQPHRGPSEHHETELGVKLGRRKIEEQPVTQQRRKSKQQASTVLKQQLRAYLHPNPQTQSRKTRPSVGF